MIPSMNGRGRGMRHRRVRGLLLVLLIGPLCLALSDTALAADPSASGTTRMVNTLIVLKLPEPTKAGQKISILATLRSNSGPVSNETLHLFLDGDRTGLRTNTNGTAEFHVKRSTPAGLHAITVQYHGNQPRSLAPASASGALTILPLTAVLQTAPALSGVSFTVDGSRFTTDASGMVRVPIAAAGNHTLSAEGPAPLQGRRVNFAHWSDDQPAATRQWRVFQDVVLYAAFDVAYLTTMNFVDMDGHSVDQARVSDVQVLEPEGSIITLKAPYEPMWLAIPAPARDLVGVATHDRRFSLVSARVDGVEVVNRGDDPFVPSADGRWTIKLRLYSLVIQARHAILPGAISARVRITASGGSARSVLLDKDGGATLRDVPRGNYTVQALVNGFSPPAPVVLSRSQSVDLKVVDGADLAVGTTMALVLFVLLFSFARPPAFLRRFRGGVGGRSGREEPVPSSS